MACAKSQFNSSKIERINAKVDALERRGLRIYPKQTFYHHLQHLFWRQLEWLWNQCTGNKEMLQYRERYLASQLTNPLTTVRGTDS